MAMREIIVAAVYDMARPAMPFGGEDLYEELGV
jgi:hypothetical protein